VVIDNFNVNWIAAIPPETYPILIVDADRVLPRAIALQFLKPIAWRNPKMLDLFHGSYLEEISSSDVDEIRRAHLAGSLCRFSVIDVFGSRVRKGHRSHYTA